MHSRLGAARLPTRPTHSGSATATHTGGMAVLAGLSCQAGRRPRDNHQFRRSDVRALVRDQAIVSRPSSPGAARFWMSWPSTRPSSRRRQASQQPGNSLRRRFAESTAQQSHYQHRWLLCLNAKRQTGFCPSSSQPMNSRRFIRSTRRLRLGLRPGYRCGTQC